MAHGLLAVLNVAQDHEGDQIYEVLSTLLINEWNEVAPALTWANYDPTVTWANAENTGLGEIDRPGDYVLDSQNNLNNTNSIIVVAGDVIDNGIDLHPRSVRLTKDFIILMAEIADVIVISGNHDLSKQNDEDNGLSSII